MNVDILKMKNSEMLSVSPMAMITSLVLDGSLFPVEAADCGKQTNGKEMPSGIFGSDDQNTSMQKSLGVNNLG